MLRRSFSSDGKDTRKVNFPMRSRYNGYHFTYEKWILREWIFLEKTIYAMSVFFKEPNYLNSFSNWNGPFLSQFLWRKRVFPTSISIHQLQRSCTSITLLNWESFKRQTSNRSTSITTIVSAGIKQGLDRFALTE